MYPLLARVTYSCEFRINSEVLQPNLCTARRDPKIIALCGTEERELKGRAGLKVPVLASSSAAFDPGGWNGVTSPKAAP